MWTAVLFPCCLFAQYWVIQSQQKLWPQLKYYARSWHLNVPPRLLEGLPHTKEGDSRRKTCSLFSPLHTQALRLTTNCADLLFCLSIDFVHLFFLTSPGACISTTNPLKALTLTCLDCRLINKPQMYKLNLKNLLPFLSIPGLQWLLCPFSAPFSL